MKQWPLRLKVSLWAVLLGGATLLIIGAIGAWRVEAVALRNLDDQLRRQTSQLLTNIAQRSGPVDWNSPEQAGQVLGPLDARGVQIEQAPNLKVYDSLPAMPAGLGTEPVTAEIQGTKVRILQAAREGTVVRVAADLAPIGALVRNVWVTCSFALPLVLISMGIAGWWLSRRILRPVEELATDLEEAAATMDTETKNRNLPSRGGDAEIGHLTDILNSMFTRMRQSYQQARRFSADASHELKTPLTIIRGEVEAALRSEQLAPQTEKLMIDLLEETGRLISIVEGLLLLSQADAGKLQFDLKPVNMSALLSEIVEDVEILASPREISVFTDFQTNVLIKGNAQFLRQVALNLFDNAIKYNRHRGEIRATLSVHNGLAIFAISNTGEPIPEEDRAHIFDRFHRAEPSRDRTRGGHGLGLSICREITRVHQGDITLEPSHSGWTRFQVTLPLPSQEFTESAVRRADDVALPPPLASEPQAVVTRGIR
jgi:signal transduction histidine kinase